MSDQLGSERLGLTTEWAIQQLEEKCDQFREKLAKGLTVEKVCILYFIVLFKVIVDT